MWSLFSLRNQLFQPWAWYKSNTAWVRFFKKTGMARHKNCYGTRNNVDDERVTLSRHIKNLNMNGSLNSRINILSRTSVPVPSSPRFSGTFCHVIHGINHVTKRRTPSPDKDSMMESKACYPGV